jgi:hypothetical protein
MADSVTPKIWHGQQRDLRVLFLVEVKVSTCQQKNLYTNLTMNQIQNLLNESQVVYR